jgi:putative hydrolase of the HAD superfamily
VTVVRACLVDVYDTILKSFFEKRVEALVTPLGIGVGDWLTEWEKTREDRDRGRLTTAAAMRQVLTALGVEPDPALVEDLLRRDAAYARSHTMVFDDTVPFLTWLRSRGVLIALVSNCSDTTRPQLERLGLIPLVDSVILSCEIGSMKPQKEMYVTPLEELGVAAVDAVFIDDQPRFCAGAEAVGIRAIQIARDEPDGYASPLNFPVVRSLLDAQPLLAADEAGL